jgi:phosphotransferase system  glucose/maltose/N-acetylglucosamine-specific IIC component
MKISKKQVSEEVIMNKTKKLTILTALLAVNAVQASDPLLQQIISALFSRKSAEIAAGVGVAALAQATAQRAASYYTFPQETFVLNKKENSYITMNNKQGFFAQGPYGSEYGVKHPQMGSYTNTIITSAAIGLCAAAVACIGTSPLSASEVIKPVAIGAGIVAGNYALGYGIGYSLMHKNINELENYDSSESSRNFRRYEAARNAYSFASGATLLGVAGAVSWMIYERYNRS